MPPKLPEAHRLQQQRLRKAVAANVERLWRALPGYDEADAEVFRKQAAAVVRAGQRSSISTVDAYLARYMKRAAMGIDSGAIIEGLRAGTPGEDVYRRPFVTTWTALKEGAQWADAVEAGLAHALASVEGDMQLAARQAASEIGQADDGIYGYARVAGGNACELCLIASTQRYHVEDLMPIHDRCGCTVEPITEPTGRVINRDQYREMKADGAMDRVTRGRIENGYRSRAEANRERAAATRKEMESESDADRRERLALRAESWDQRAREQESTADRVAGGGPSDVTVAVRNHGEMGPVLTNADHEFTAL